jgi:hypothetical protein
MKKRLGPLTCLAVGAALLTFAGCRAVGTTAHSEHPAEVEQVPDSDIARLTLTERAIDRLDLQTAAVTGGDASSPAKVVPYGALIYDAHGDTWVYTMPRPRTFIRSQVKVDRIDGDNVLLAEGPDVGTLVATAGVAELYGTEFKVGH